MLDIGAAFHINLRSRGGREHKAVVKLVLARVDRRSEPLAKVCLSFRSALCAIDYRSSLPQSTPVGYPSILIAESVTVPAGSIADVGSHQYCTLYVRATV
jgi:hypothetical protein